MIIIEKNPGTKIPFEVNGTKITFDDELALKLAKLQKDDPVHKDICFDSEGDLCIGTKEGKYYVAEIDIPAIEYEAEGDGDEQELVPVPLDMDKVTLILWSIDDKTKIEED